MNKVKLSMNEQYTLSVIKDLLCLMDNSKFTIHTPISEIEFIFKGNIYNVRNALKNWLDVPERIEQTEQLKG